MRFPSIPSLSPHCPSISPQSYNLQVPYSSVPSSFIHVGTHQERDNQQSSLPILVSQDGSFRDSDGHEGRSEEACGRTKGSSCMAVHSFVGQDKLISNSIYRTDGIPMASFFSSLPYILSVDFSRSPIQWNHQERRDR